MIKYSIPVLLALSIILLGLAVPFETFSGPRRDPVPPAQKVAHSLHCSGCHGSDTTVHALVDDKGNDVSIYNDWRISMMGMSAHDPFWRATVAHEVSLFPSARESIETTCLKCHAPLGSIQSTLDGNLYSFETMLGDSLGLDGVSCSACHQQPANGLGSAHSGNLRIDTNRIMYGHYPNPFVGPMQLYVGFEPVFADHILSSGVCAGCHTLLTESLDEEGQPTGQIFVEQATYHEWLNSNYPAQGKECQSCHLPFIEDSVVIATDFLALKKRHPFGLHQFFGANTAMLSIMKTHRKELGIASGSTDTMWNESIHNNRISIQNAGTISVTSLLVENDTLYLDLFVKNMSGHKLPSGYPSRIAWIQIALTDSSSKDTLFASGFMDPEGDLVGRDLPFEPHHQVLRSPDDVQIYEMVMGDAHGHLTTRLNAAAEPLKDNRLLPAGFKRTHSTYDTVAVWGEALSDPQYDSESQLGSDKIQYRIPLNGSKGTADLDISFRYHTFPSRWMEDLFTPDSLEAVSVFKSMYAGYERFDELIDDTKISAISLATSSVYPTFSVENIVLFPNPGNGNQIFIDGLDSYVQPVFYQISDLKGNFIDAGMAHHKIVLREALPKGLYHVILHDRQGNSVVKPYIVL